MLSFEPLTITAKGTLLPYYHQYGEGSCQHSFVSSFCMSGKYGDQVCVQNGFLYTLRSMLCTEQERVYLFPLGERNPDDAICHAVTTVVEDAHAYGCRARFETVTEGAAEYLMRLFPGRFVIDEKRDYAEYLYTHDKLALLPGHEMASKRHDISTFDRQYAGRYVVQRIETAEQVDEIRPFQSWWKAERMAREEDVQLEREDESIRIGLEHFFELGLSGILVYIDDRLAGYAYGAALSDDCYDVMIEKGDRSAPDVYKILNRDLVRLCCDGMTWINREEDLGVEGLRKAKLSYKPDRLIRKFSVREAMGE